MVAFPPPPLIRRVSEGNPQCLGTLEASVHQCAGKLPGVLPRFGAPRELGPRTLSLQRGVIMVAAAPTC
eukprot:10556582-Heterocapsa_arctica.AAC.1